MGIIRVIYADSLLIVNFSMDFLALYITLKLQNGVIHPIRMSAAALIGALWALISVLLEAYISNIASRAVMLAANIVCAAVVISLASGARRPSLKSTLTFGAVNIGLGGIMTALYSILEKVVGNVGLYDSGTAPGTSGLIFIFAAAVAGAVSLVYGRFKADLYCRKKVRMTFTAFGREGAAQLLCDSGNLLCDPFSGKPVIILAAKQMYEILPDELLYASQNPEHIAYLPGEMSGTVRLIPANTVSGARVMICFTPQRVEIEGRVVDALLALDAYSEDYAGYDGIVGQTLLSV